MITQQQFADRAFALSREANVLNNFHGYFLNHCSRLYKTSELFNLFDSKLGDVLEVGPFYAYTPFLLKSGSTSYTVLEGDDPAVYPLKPLYEKNQISLRFVDLFESFGPTHSASHSLDFKDGSFDTVLCWETMEHFNFNPVKFVRELHRVLKPGGRACITVPNKASFHNLLSLVSGKAESSLIDSYYEFEDYRCNGKKAFYGFHWREYSRAELARLFSKAGFRVRECNTFVAFQANSNLSVARRLARSTVSLVAGCLHRYGTNVYLLAEK